MNDEIERRIHLVRDALKTDPDGMEAGKLPPGVARPGLGAPGLQQYADFLTETNGPRCGAMDFWSATELPQKQYVVGDFPGGAERWTTVGQILYEPLAVDHKTGEVHWISVGTPDDVSNTFGQFDDFVVKYVFGSGYADLIPDVDDEPWYQILIKLKLA